MIMLSILMHIAKVLKYSFVCTLAAYLSVPTAFSNMINIKEINEIKFVGRERQLNTIRSYFLTGKSPISIVGMPGIGKSFLAYQYGSLNKSQYDFVYWFYSIDRHKQLKEFAGYLNKNYQFKIETISIAPSTLYNNIIKALSSSNLKFLLIFDNVTSLEEIKPFGIFKGLGQDILTTSQNPYIEGPKVQLDIFSEEESEAFFKENTHLKNPDYARKLTCALGSYPLALFHVSHYLKTHPTFNKEKFLSLIEESKDKAIQVVHLGNMSDIERDTAVLRKIMASALGLVLNNLKKDDLLALEMLRFLSVTKNQSIPEELLKDFFNLKDTHEQYHRALRTLLSHSLIHIENDKGGRIRYRIHEMVQVIVRNQMSLSEVRSILSRSAKMLTSHKFNQRIDRLVQELMEDKTLLEHADSVMQRSIEYGFYSTEVLTLSVRVLECYLSGMRDYSRAKAILDILMNIPQREFLPEDYGLLLMAKGNHHGWSSPDYEKAIFYLQKSYDILKNITSYKHEAFRAIVNLAQMKLLSGQVRSAEAYLNTASTIEKAVESPVYRSLYFYVRSLAYHDLGEFDKSLSLISLAVREIAHLDFAVAMVLSFKNLEAKTHWMMHQDKDARSLAYKGLGDSNRFFGTSDNIFSATARLIIALTDTNSNNDTESEIKNIIEVYDKGYNGTHKHRNQFFAHTALGNLYLSKNNLILAREHLDIAQSIYNNVYGTNVVYELGDILLLMVKIALKEKNKNKLQEGLELQIHFFGTSHPLTKNILHIIEQHESKVSIKGTL